MDVEKTNKCINKFRRHPNSREDFATYIEHFEITEGRAPSLEELDPRIRLIAVTYFMWAWKLLGLFFIAAIVVRCLEG